MCWRSPRATPPPSPANLFPVSDLLTMRIYFRYLINFRQDLSTERVHVLEKPAHRTAFIPMNLCPAPIYPANLFWP